MTMIQLPLHALIAGIAARILQATPEPEPTEPTNADQPEPERTPA